MDAHGCVVHSDGRLTAVVGVEDLVVVSTSDAVLVVPRARVAGGPANWSPSSRRASAPEATDHQRVHRPWGYYESIDMGERFQVKRIVVTPGGILSLQKHRHRAEHWVVVRGTAEVTDRRDGQDRARERVDLSSRSAASIASPTTARSRSS